MLVVLIAALAAFAPATANAQTGFTLEGEYLFSSTGVVPAVGTAVMDANCDAEGPSTVTVRATGVAVGPYPGVFEETITFTLSAPLAPGDPARAVVDAEARFRIVSGETEIVGTKRLTSERPPFSEFPVVGRCIVVPYERVCVQTLAGGSAHLEYQATIITPTGTFSDQGISHNNAGGQRIQCGEPPSFLFETAGLSENFLFSFNARTPGRATGGGQILHVPPESGVSFGFVAYATEERLTDGRCSVVDHAADVHIRCLDVATFVRTGNTATFSGQADVNGTVTTYAITVVDNSEPGSADFFSIQTGTGYTAAGPLTDGNIVLHEP